MTRRTHLNLETLEGRSLLSSLADSLTTNQTTYLLGQPVQMAFQESNTTNHAIMVDIGPSIDGFTVTQDGSEVWRSNAGVNPLFILLKTLQPGQSLTLTATWDGIPTGGSAPVSGQFVIFNQLDPKAASATVTISDSTTSSPPSAPVPPPATSGSSPVALSVTTNHPTYQRGHPVRMTVTLHNASANPVDVSRDSGVDGFTVFEGSTEVWHAARTVPGRLKPGQSVKLNAVWNGRLAARAAPGTYTIEAVEGSDSGSTTFRITA